MTVNTPPPVLELWLAPGSYAEATARGVTFTSGPFGGSAALVFPDALPYVDRAAILAQFGAVVSREEARYASLDQVAVPAQRTGSGS
jgi:hypothetical protein